MASMTDTPRWLLAPLWLASAVFLGPQAVLAQAPDRSGKDVVETVCAACHASGAKGAPKIGDKKAWSKRASQGLTSPRRMRSRAFARCPRTAAARS
jgi:cytochrome c5